MPRKIIKKVLPDPNWIKQHKSLSIFGSWLHDPNIWHLNRHSVARATFIGFFVAFVPLPFQMIIAALLAVLFRVNLAISVSLVWITNPLTMAPIFYLAYKVGAAVMSVQAKSFDFEPTIEWLTTGLANSWQPFLLGCLLCGLFFGLLTSTLINWVWREHTIRRWNTRRLNRASKQSRDA